MPTKSEEREKSNNMKKESKSKLSSAVESVKKWFKDTFSCCGCKAKGKGRTKAKEGGKAESAEPKKERKWWVVILINGAIAIVALVVIVMIVNAVLGGVTRHGKNVDVPNMVGESLQEARKMAQKNDLNIVVSDSLYVPYFEGGVVLEQRPSAGKAKVKSGRKIYLTVNSTQSRQVEVPHVAGFSLRQAVGNLLSSGLEVEVLEYRADLANNYVLEQIYEGVAIVGDSVVMAPVGSSIKLIVGSNQTSAEPIPNLVGKTLREAKNILWTAGFNVGHVEFDEQLNLLEQTSAVIYEQTPVANMNGYQGDRVSLKLSYAEEEE